MTEPKRDPMKDAVAVRQSHRAAALGMGGPERIERQHRQGKMTVRERIDFLLDRDSF